MGVRDFRDNHGREWRVWNVMPEAIHPQTKAEDYLADIYQTGWLVFETKAEDEKRRLSAVPVDWERLPPGSLVALLERAEVIPPRKLRAERQARGAEAARQQDRAVRRAEELADRPAARLEIPEEERPDVTDLGVVRTFRYPGGRFWTVGVVRHPEDGGAPVLRFTSGLRDIDLRDWPKDWADYPDERLVELIRLAAPRAIGRTPDPETPRRRHNEPPSGR